MVEIYRPELLDNFIAEYKLDFRNRVLLQRALTHKSFANENSELGMKNNERLEFLGDSVLSLVISTYIFTHFPDHPEGELAKMRSVIVSEPVLAGLAKKMGLGRYLFLSKGEELSGGRERDSILADSVEALIGAIYLDRDFKRVEEFLIPLFEDFINDVKEGRYVKDYKTLLQEVLQRDGNQRPDYRVVSESGPDHNKRFLVEVSYRKQGLGKGEGSSKKEAEQEAARNALKNLREL